VVDWGPLEDVDELARRTESALEMRPRRQRPVTPDQVDEIRIVHTWIAANDPPLLELDPVPPRGELERWVRRAACLP
jgi:hypothetical protein